MGGMGIVTIPKQDTVSGHVMRGSFVFIFGNEKMGRNTHLRFRDLQVSYLDTASGEIRDLELDVDRALRFALGRTAHATSKPTGHTATEFVIALDGGEAELGAHEELLAAAELLDLPDDGRLLGSVVDCADVCTEAGRICVVRDGDDDFNVVGGAAALELCLGLEVG